MKPSNPPIIYQPPVRIVSLLALLWPLALAGSARSATPALGSISPRGGQCGTQMSVFFHGDRLDDAREVLFYSPGLRVDELKAHDAKKVEAIVTIAEDCRLGEHCMRVRTATGISPLRTFWVGQFPAVGEKEPNSDFENPQAIGMNVTVTGVVQNEDVDYFILEAKKGQRISAEIEAMRLGQVMFDPYVAIQDMDRFELSASDDSALLLQDSVASIVASEDTTYVIQVRESAYGGSGGCRYRLHVGTFARPRVVYPAGGRVGQQIELRMIGDVAGPFTQTVKLPQTPQHDFEVFAGIPGQEQMLSPSPNRFRVVDFDNVLEVEANDAPEQATTTNQALPAAFNGVIEQAGDQDWFRFTAEKDQHFNVRVHARSIRSPLDSVLSIHDAAAKQLAHNDDSGGPDSAFRFKFPADGEYLLCVRDHLDNGGADYVYRVEFMPIRPTLTVQIPRFGRDSQARQTISVPRGNRTASLMTVSRGDFGGEIVYEAPDLPEGVSLLAEQLPSDLRQFPVVFEAAADAPVAGRLVQMSARHADPQKQIRGQFDQNIELVLGSPNRTVYYRRRVDRLAVAVVEEAPFTIQIVEPKVVLVQNGSMNLKVVAVRKEGFVDPITVRLLWHPPGVGASQTIKMEKGASEVLYPINANSGAQRKTWKITVLGEAAGYRVASRLTNLTVAPPYVGMKIEMTALEQGQNGQLFCKLQQHEPFQGPAEVSLLGLPAKVTTTPQLITKDDQELAFELKIDKASPPGKHKGLFCQVVVTANGEPIVHSVGQGGVLRIDRPPPAPKKEAAKPAPKPKPEPTQQKKPQKRLTRLEKLRLQARERAEAAKQ